MLNSLNKLIRFPIKGKISDACMKRNCIIQAVLGGIRIEDYSMVQESLQIFSIASRICTCLIQYVKEKKFYSVLVNALLLYRVIFTSSHHQAKVY